VRAHVILESAVSCIIWAIFPQQTAELHRLPIKIWQNFPWKNVDPNNH